MDVVVANTEQKTLEIERSYADMQKNERRYGEYCLLEKQDIYPSLVNHQKK